jgi:hypothetical protein
VPAPLAAGQPEVRFLDLPLLTGDEPVTSGYLAAVQSPWPGTLAVYRSPETTGFQLKGFISAASAIGKTLTGLSAGPEGRIDRATRLQVQFGSGAVAASVSLIKMLSGANVAAVQYPTGAWEVVQFETATLIAAHTYELCNLLRGQAGTESVMAALSAGAPVVILGTGLTRLELSAGEVGLPMTWRIGPASRDLGSQDFIEASHTFLGVGARPLSPVHVRGKRSGGDLNLSWIRRTRSGGDSWTAAEVPLAEDTEAYEADIMAGATVKRTLVSGTPGTVYTAAQQIADFGALQASITVRVHQISAVWGRGTARAATV